MLETSDMAPALVSGQVCINRRECPCLTTRFLRPIRRIYIRGRIDFPATAARVETADSPKWGRHGFDGSDCGQEAYRGACVRNCVQKHNCQPKPGIRSL